MNFVTKSFFKAFGLWALLMTVFIVILLLATKAWPTEEGLEVRLTPGATTPIATIGGVAEQDGNYFFNKKTGITVEALQPDVMVTVVGDGKIGGLSGGMQLLLVLPSDLSCPSRFEEDITRENGQVRFPTGWSSGTIEVVIKSGENQIELTLQAVGKPGDVSTLTIYGESVADEFEIPSVADLIDQHHQSTFNGPAGDYFWVSWVGEPDSLNPAYPVSWGGCDGKLVPTWEMVGNQLTETAHGVPTIYQTLGGYDPGICWGVFPELFGTDGHPLDPNDGQLHLAIRGRVTGLVPSLAVESLPNPKPYRAWAHWDGENWGWRFITM